MIIVCNRGKHAPIFFHFFNNSNLAAIFLASRIIWKLIFSGVNEFGSWIRTRALLLFFICILIGSSELVLRIFFCQKCIITNFLK